MTEPATATTAVTTPTPVDGQLLQTSSTTVKPGYKTTEFWLKLLAILLSALFASGVIPTTGVAAQVTAIAAVMLGALGYTVVRGNLKGNAAPMLLVLLLVPAAANLTACATSTQNAALAGVYVAVTTSCDTFVAVNVQRQEDLRLTATSEADAVAKVTDWRKKSASLPKDCDAGKAAVKAAIQLQNDQTLAGATQALATITAGLKSAGITVPSSNTGASK